MKKLLTLFVIFLTVYYSAAQAPDPFDIQMDDLVVTGTRTPLPIKSTPVITQVISGEEIERQGISTIEELLTRELPGIEFHQAGYGTTLSFQGLDARYVLFLIDGERMAGETYGNIDYQRIPLNNVERIEIVKGASSVLYGSNAMGAVVNIITRMPQEKFEAAASVRYGTPYQKNKDEQWLGATDSDRRKYRNRIDLPNVKADLSLGFNTGKLRSLTTGTFQATDAYKIRGRRAEKRTYDEMTIMRPNIVAGAGGMGMEFDESGMPVFIPARAVADTVVTADPDSRGLAVSGWMSWSVGQKFDYTLNEKFRFELSGNYYHKNRYDFQTSLMDDNPVSAYFGSTGPWQYETYEGYGLKFLMEHTPNANNKVYLTFMRDESRRYQDQLHESRVPKQRHAYNIPRLLWTSNIGESHRLTTGLEFTDERLRFDLNSSGNGYDDMETLSTISLYTQDEIWSGRPLSFVAGVRADWNNKFGWRATPRVSAKYTINDLSFRANYSMGYRSPSLKEMYMVLDLPIASSPKIIGNPELKAETNNYVSFSVEYATGRFYASAIVGQSFFRNKIDAVVQTTEEQKQVLKYENIDKSRLGTLEFMVRYRPVRDLTLQANYNYIYEDNNAPEGSTQYIYPSAHTATFSVDYSHDFKACRLFANVNVRYVGPKDYHDFMPYIVIPDALANYIAMDNRPPITQAPGVMESISEFKYYTGNYLARHSGYAVCNASVGMELLSSLAVTLGFDNIFDYRPKVVNFNSALLPGFNGFVQLSYRF